MEIPNEVKNKMEQLHNHGHESYIVGGAVRDTYLNIEPKDWDIFTPASGEEILSIFPNGIVLGGEERQNKILTVIVDDIEISQYRANPTRTETCTDIKMHLSTCDFTINAMYMDINGNITDPHEGKAHFAEGILSCVGVAKDRIAEDKLRALRAIRFMARYGLKPDYDLAGVLFDVDISTLPVERIQTELKKIMESTEGIFLLHATELLYKIFPEFNTLDIDGGNHHNEKVIEHSIYANQIACGLTNNTTFRLAALFHDIGKGFSFQQDEEGMHFKKHDKVGAETAREILNEHKYSKADINYICGLIEYHMFDFKKSSTKAFRKLFAKLEKLNIPVEDLALMNYCDNQANLKNQQYSYHEFIKDNTMTKKYYEMKYSKDPFTIRDLEINGHDVIAHGITDGKTIGKVLNAIFGVVCDGIVENKRPLLMNILKWMTEEPTPKHSLSSLGIKTMLNNETHKETIERYEAKQNDSSN